MHAVETRPALPILPRLPNLRCLGDIAGDGERTVRMNRFLRAPALTELTAGEAQSLVDLDPALVVDFRNAEEVRKRPTNLPDDLAPRRVALPIDTGASLRISRQELTTAEDARNAMLGAYRDFVVRHADVFARFLCLCAQAGPRGVIFHCTAGKDRTGFAAALLLAALGADRETILADFMRSGVLWSPDMELRARLPLAAQDPVFGVDPAYLDVALDTLDREHGGAKAFAQKVMGGPTALDAWRDQHLQ